MKKLVISILLLLSFSMTIFCFAPQTKIARAQDKNISDNAIIVLSGKLSEEGEVEIQASLSQNTGISAMTLTLSYDKDVMTLTNVKRGNALSSLDYITTNTDTEQGYQITPFVFNYSGNANDTSTGILFSLTFKLNENIKDGTYKVSLIYNKDKDVVYYDERDDVQTKNLLIDNAEIEFKNNSIIEIKSVRAEEVKTSNTWTIILIVGGSIIVVSAVVVLIIFLKRRRNWKRLWIKQ